MAHFFKKNNKTKEIERSNRVNVEAPNNEEIKNQEK